MLKRRPTKQKHYAERTGIRPQLERYCRQFRAPRALRDPAPPAPWPRWGFGGAARRRHQPKRRISMSKSAKKRSPRPAHTETTAAKPSPLAMSNPPRPHKADPGSKQSRVIDMLQSHAGAQIAGVR